MICTSLNVTKRHLYVAAMAMYCPSMLAASICSTSHADEWYSNITIITAGKINITATRMELNRSKFRFNLVPFLAFPSDKDKERQVNDATSAQGA